MMKAYITWIIRYRVVVLILLLVITGMFAAFALQGVFASTLGGIFFGDDHQGYTRYRQRIREFASDDVVIIVYKDEHPLSEKSLRRLEGVVAQLEDLLYVVRVDSLLNAQHTFAEEDTLYANRYADEALEQPENSGAILNNLKTDPFYDGLLISEDGQYAAILLESIPAEDAPAEHAPVFIGKIMSILEQGGFERRHLHRVGLAATVAEVIIQSNFNISRLFPIGCVILLVVVFLMFHRFWPVAITLGVSFVGVIWAFGFAVFLDRNITIFTSIIPIVILIVATSDIIHLCSAYLLELAQGKEKMEAILQSGIEVGTACFWTSATTFVGFMAMSFVPVPMFKQLGKVLGFGVAVSLSLAMTLCPILFTLMKTPQPHTYDASWAQKLLGRALSSVEEYFSRRPRMIVALFLLAFAWSFAGSIRITVETNLNKRFQEDSQIRRDERFYEAHFAGSNFLEIFINTQKSQGVLDPEIYTKIEAFHKAVAQLPEVDKVVSFVNLIETIDRELNPGGHKEGADYWTRALLAQYLLLFETSGGEDIDRLVDFDRQTLHFAVRLTDTGTIFTYATGEKIKKIAASVLGDRVDVEATGISYLLGEFIDDVVAGQRRGLIFAFATIMVMMIVMFRSLKIGVVSMIPNVLPLLALGGYLGFFWHTVDSDTILIAMIAIGIGVDDTIHFLSRLRFESARTRDPGTALKRTFHFSGRAMVTTTLILVAGFMPLGLSSYFTVRIFGTLLPFTLVVAVLADLLLVPALVKLDIIRFPHSDE